MVAHMHFIKHYLQLLSEKTISGIFKKKKFPQKTQPLSRYLEVLKTNTCFPSLLYGVLEHISTK